MEVLIFVKIIFYSLMSLVIIVLGIFLGVITYQLVRITRNLRKISDTISSVSKDTQEKVREIIDGLSNSPFLSYFIKKDRDKTTKGRSSK